MKTILQMPDGPVSLAGRESCVTKLDYADLHRAVESSAQGPSWQEKAARALFTAAHRAEKARARGRYWGCSIHLPPHPVLLNEAWATEQLRQLPSGKQWRATTVPKISLKGICAPARPMEQDTSVWRAAGFAGKGRF